MQQIRKNIYLMSRGSAVGIAAGCKVDNKEVEVRVPTGPGAHPTYYPLGTWGTFRGGKEAGA
jgi:hypothetical protein